MAGCDYMSCAKCGGKTFYDAEVTYGFKWLDDPIEGYTGQAGALCRTCVGEFELVIVPRKAPMEEACEFDIRPTKEV